MPPAGPPACRGSGPAVCNRRRAACGRAPRQPPRLKKEKGEAGAAPSQSPRSRAAASSAGGDGAQVGGRAAPRAAGPTCRARLSGARHLHRGPGVPRFGGVGGRGAGSGSGAGASLTARGTGSCEAQLGAGESRGCRGSRAPWGRFPVGTSPWGRRCPVPVGLGPAGTSRTRSRSGAGPPPGCGVATGPLAPGCPHRGPPHGPVPTQRHVATSPPPAPGGSGLRRQAEAAAGGVGRASRR